MKDEVTKLAMEGINSESLVRLVEEVCLEHTLPSESISPEASTVLNEYGETAPSPTLTDDTEPNPLTNIQTQGELLPIPFPESGCVLAMHSGRCVTIAQAYVRIVTIDGMEIKLSDLQNHYVGFFRAPKRRLREYVWDSPERRRSSEQEAKIIARRLTKNY